MGNFVWASGGGQEKVGGSRKKCSGGAKGRVRLLRERGSAEPRKVASGSAMQGLWLRDSKVGFQAIGEDQSRLPGRGAVEEEGEEEDEEK